MADDRNEDDRNRSSGAGKVVRAAADEVEALTGQEVAWVSGFQRTDDGWKVTLEVVELKRIPDTTSVLASYVAVTDADGNVAQLERTRRYTRSSVNDGET